MFDRFWVLGVGPAMIDRYLVYYRVSAFQVRGVRNPGTMSGGVFMYLTFLEKLCRQWKDLDQGYMPKIYSK